MKKIYFLYLLLISVFSTAQDIQLHYDFGKPQNEPARDYMVSTVEMFIPDSLGSTFFFIDFEYNSPDKPRGVSLGYFEISREFNIPWFKNNKILKPIALHIEYDDGNSIYKSDSIIRGTNLGSSWLAGFAYPFHIGKFTINSIYLYKYIRGSSSPDAQLTLVWCQNIFRNRLTLSGFVDVWTQDGNSKNKLVVLYSEPQIWINVFRKLAVGSEFKISKNFFPFSNRLEVFPTIGVKWTW